MYRKLFPTLILLILLIVPPLQARNYVIIIIINDLEPANCPCWQSNTVPACYNKAINFDDPMHNYESWRIDELFMLSDYQATTNNIRKTFAQFASQAHVDDNCLIYYGYPDFAQENSKAHLDSLFTYDGKITKEEWTKIQSELKCHTKVINISPKNKKDKPTQAKTEEGWIKGVWNKIRGFFAKDEKENPPANLEDVQREQVATTQPTESMDLLGQDSGTRTDTETDNWSVVQETSW